MFWSGIATCPLPLAPNQGTMVKNRLPHTSLYGKIRHADKTTIIFTGGVRSMQLLFSRVALFADTNSHNCSNGTANRDTDAGS